MKLNHRITGGLVAWRLDEVPPNCSPKIRNGTPMGEDRDGGYRGVYGAIPLHPRAWAPGRPPGARPPIPLSQGMVAGAPFGLLVTPFRQDGDLSNDLTIATARPMSRRPKKNGRGGRPGKMQKQEERRATQRQSLRPAAAAAEVVRRRDEGCGHRIAGRCSPDRSFQGTPGLGMTHHDQAAAWFALQSALGRTADASAVHVLAKRAGG